MDCQVHNVRLGLQGLVHLRPGEKLDPWLGIGVGHEWLAYSAEGVSGMYATKINFRFSGMEFLQLQSGLDAWVSDALAVGPFLSFSIGQYGSGAVRCTGDCFSNPSYDDEIERAVHHWLLLGAKGNLLL